MNVSDISELLERDKSTIYREINQGTVEFRKSDWSVRKEYSAILFIEYKATVNE